MSKYQQAIDLHNKAIDILEKRQKAFQKLAFLEESIVAYNEEKEFAVRVYKLSELNYSKSVQERYIRLLTKAYGRLAATVCSEVHERVDNPFSEINTTNIEYSEIKVFPVGSKKLSDDQKAD